MISRELNDKNWLPTRNNVSVRQEDYNLLREDVIAIEDAIGLITPGEGAFDTITEYTAATGVTVDGVLLKDAQVSTDVINENNSGNGVTVDGMLIKDGGFSSLTTNVAEFTKEVELTVTEIVGTAAGDIGHTDGAIIVAAPTSDYALEFVSAVLIYDYATAAYTGGNDDMTFRVGSVACSSAITDTNCIKATGDKVYRLGSIATETSLPVGSTINLKGTAFTNPGTAAGKLRVQVTYRVHTTGL